MDDAKKYQEITLSQLDKNRKDLRGDPRLDGKTMQKII
jgi:hypothetical protein